MKKIIIALFTVLIFFFIGYYSAELLTDSFMKSKVLSEKAEVIPTEVPPTPTTTPAPTSTPTVTPTPRPTNTPTPSPVPQPKVTSSEIHAFMERFAGQYAVDVNVLRAIAICESGFNPGAVNGPYAGLFQFNKTAWKNGRILMGEDPDYDLRFNAEESVQTAAYLISQGKRYLWPNCNP